MKESSPPTSSPSSETVSVDPLDPAYGPRPGFEAITPSQSNAKVTLQKVLSTLRKLRADRQVDLDNLASDIWLQAWVNQTPLTAAHIRHRLINRVRDTRLYNQRIEESLAVSEKSTFDLDLEKTRAFLDLIISKAELSKDEISLLYAIFFADETHEQIARRLHWSEYRVKCSLSITLEKLQRAGRLVIGKGETK